jgi:1,4-dihydroxy-2-naphthoyl-CoA hydrolase
MTMDPLTIIDGKRMPFADSLGISILSAAPERLTAEMLVRENLCTVPAVLHGGAVMAFADSLGAYATMLNLPEGASTTTIESKTNFFAPAPAGTIVTGECAPLHRGRRTMVWQTRITNAQGRLLALVTQTQMVLEAPARG